MTVSYRDWHEMLPFALHGYRTSVRTSTGATSFSLVYGMEVVLPFEVEVPSLRILAESGLKESEWAQTRYDQLNLIESQVWVKCCRVVIWLILCRPLTSTSVYCRFSACMEVSHLLWIHWITSEHWIVFKRFVCNCYHECTELPYDPFNMNIFIWRMISWAWYTSDV